MTIEHEVVPSLCGAGLQTVILLQRGESSTSNLPHQVNKPSHHEQTQARKLQNESAIDGIFSENNEERVDWPPRFAAKEKLTIRRFVLVMTNAEHFCRTSFERPYRKSNRQRLRFLFQFGESGLLLPISNNCRFPRNVPDAHLR